MLLKEKFGQNEKGIDDKVCIAVNTHINQCATCRARYLKQSVPFSISRTIEEVLSKFQTNSDTVTVILICIMILLIIKLFNR